MALDHSVALGRIRTPSGTVLIVDPGYLGMWCHDRPPLLPPGVLDSDEETEEANRAIDLKIIGPDAERAGVLFDRGANPFYLFDIPRDGEPSFRRMFEEMTAAQGLDARLCVLPQRISHRARVDLALAQGNGAGELQFHGMWCCAIAGLPCDVELPVLAEPMPPGPDQGRWRRVVVPCREGQVAKTELVGRVMVDYARLMVADVDALGCWVHEEPLDGLADFAFWGRDAAAVAEELGASVLDEESFGWKDLPASEAARRGAEVKRIRAGRGFRFATDFRPHSHNHQLLEQVRRSASESGCVDLCGARLCGFQNTWGDFLFEVHRDLDQHGNLLAIRLELGTPEVVGLVRRVEARWKFALVSKRITDEREPVRFAYREAADRDEDSGWRMFSGTEDDEYTNDPNNVALVRLSEMIERDPSLAHIADSSEGSVFERSGAQADFETVTDWEPPSE